VVCAFALRCAGKDGRLVDYHLFLQDFALAANVALQRVGAGEAVLQAGRAALARCRWWPGGERCEGMAPSARSAAAQELQAAAQQQVQLEVQEAAAAVAAEEEEERQQAEQQWAEERELEEEQQVRAEAAPCSATHAPRRAPCAERGPSLQPPPTTAAHPPLPRPSSSSWRPARPPSTWTTTASAAAPAAAPSATSSTGATLGGCWRAAPAGR
jgi:hypothetical protein